MIARKQVGPAGNNFPRREGSIRRTITIDTTWPEGRTGRMVIAARARDLLTNGQGQPRPLAHEALVIAVNADREIVSINSAIKVADFSHLAGRKVLKGFRAHLASMKWQDRPSRLAEILLGILPGATFVNRIAWSSLSRSSAQAVERELIEANTRMDNICAGWAEGGSALASGSFMPQEDRALLVVPLDAADDRLAWHDLPPPSIPMARRACMLDVSLEEPLSVFGYFQDAACGAEHAWRAIHEYSIFATIASPTFTITALDAIPHILPFAECPHAIASLKNLIGTTTPKVGRLVSESMNGIAGCTHLNFMIRNLEWTEELLQMMKA